jgi:SAM-dependent MidA family methyltransferase
LPPKFGGAGRRDGVNELEVEVAARVAARGPVPFSEVMDLALYDEEHGFYATGGSAGRRGDFLTSPEVGPLFGAVVARALDAWWHDAGEPDPYVVVEAGAGAGTLAVAVLAAAPECAPALRYVLVERCEALRERHRDHLSLETPAFAFAPDHRDDIELDDDLRRDDLPTGPIVVSLSELPILDGPVVVLANELLDNLAFDLLERRDGAWHEVRVGVNADGDQLVETLVPAAEPPVLDAPDGARVPVENAAERWVRDALALARPGGRVVTFDYASTTTALAARPWTEWVRTYKSHQHGAAPLDALGTQDITVEVAIDQLPPPTSDRDQAAWLRAHGIDELVEEGRRVWTERAAIGDLAAVRARSRITEAEALCDPAGLGAFRALEWR